MNLVQSPTTATRSILQILLILIFLSLPQEYLTSNHNYSTMKSSFVPLLALSFTNILFTNPAVAWEVDFWRGYNCDGMLQSYGDVVEDSGCINLLEWAHTDESAFSFNWSGQDQRLTIHTYGDEDCSGNKQAYDSDGCHGTQANFYPGGGIHSFRVQRG
jgi:hypothetical protein